MRKPCNEGERFHYINGDYSWGFSGILRFLDTSDRHLPRGKETTIYTDSVCLDKVAVFSSV